MSDMDETAAELRGRMMINELLTYTMMAVLTQHAAGRERLIHDLIGGMDGALQAVPQPTAEDRRRKEWALAHWQNLRPMFGALAMIGAEGRQ